MLTSKFNSFVNYDFANLQIRNDVCKIKQAVRFAKCYLPLHFSPFQIQIAVIKI